jgi:hypothetical protein
LKQAITLVALLWIACTPPPEQVPLVIDDATVIDPLSGQVLANHSVFVGDGRILGVEPSGGSGRFVANDTVDGTGRFLIPGLLDMHVHLFNSEEVAGRTLDLLVANGITGVREMASDCWEPRPEGALCTEDWRVLGQQVANGDRVAPRLLSLSSAPVNGASQRAQLPEGAPAFFAPGTEAEGRQLAGWLAERQVDLVKVYNSVPREAYFGLVDEASQLGLEISGHLPLGVSVVEASNAGHRTIEHARDLPLACGDYGDEYRRTMARVVEQEEGAEAPEAESRLRSILEDFDQAACRDVFETLVANQTYLVPTHGTREMDFRAGDPEYRADPRMKYMLPPIRQSWEADLDRTAGATAELVALYGEFYELGLRLTGMAHAAGVRVMAGTDANDTMIFPGFALHDELARFSEAGISPMDVLRAATTTPAEYMGLTDDLGSVSVGRLADLVLLADDPLADVGNTQSIEAVIIGGMVHDRSALDDMLQRVEIAAGSTGSDDSER